MSPTPKRMSISTPSASANSLTNTKKEIILSENSNTYNKLLIVSLMVNFLLLISAIILFTRYNIVTKKIEM